MPLTPVTPPTPNRPAIGCLSRFAAPKPPSSARNRQPLAAHCTSPATKLQTTAPDSNSPITSSHHPSPDHGVASHASVLHRPEPGLSACESGRIRSFSHLRGPRRVPVRALRREGVAGSISRFRLSRYQMPQARKERHMIEPAPATGAFPGARGTPAALLRCQGE
jgi:hypothetical protein